MTANSVDIFSEDKQDRSGKFVTAVSWAKRTICTMIYERGMLKLTGHFDGIKD
jgi:hypothetical protein